MAGKQTRLVKFGFGFMKLISPILFAIFVAASVSAEAGNDLEGDAAAIKAGSRVYSVHCFECHGMGGRGGMGANFTDEIQLHGDSYADIVNTVTKGVHGKPMTAWEKKLPANQILQVAAFVFSLKGTIPSQE